MSSTVLAHSSATSCTRPPSSARSAASARIWASREPASSGCSTRSANGSAASAMARMHRRGRCRAGRRRRSAGSARSPARRRSAQDAVADPAHVVDDPGRQLRRVDQAVRERVDLLEDHLVDVVVAGLAGLGVDRDARERARQVPLGGDHLGHRRPGAVRGGVEQRLADAVVGGGAVTLDQQLAERRHRHPAQRDLLADAGRRARRRPGAARARRRRCTARSRSRRARRSRR